MKGKSGFFLRAKSENRIILPFRAGWAKKKKKKKGKLRVGDETTKENSHPRERYSSSLQTRPRVFMQFWQLPTNEAISLSPSTIMTLVHTPHPPLSSDPRSTQYRNRY